jgi:hypothetical protein
MSASVAIAISFASFLVIVFSTFFFWNRLTARANAAGDAWSASLIGSILAIALFMICFAVGVWFSVARLKGDGWILSA